MDTSITKKLSHVRLFATPWTVAHQAPPSMGFSRQEYWSGWPFPSPGDLPNPGIEPMSPTLQADALTSEPPKVVINHSPSFIGFSSAQGHKESDTTESLHFTFKADYESRRIFLAGQRLPSYITR